MAPRRPRHDLRLVLCCRPPGPRGALSHRRTAALATARVAARSQTHRTAAGRCCGRSWHHLRALLRRWTVGLAAPSTLGAVAAACSRRCTACRRGHARQQGPRRRPPERRGGGRGSGSKGGSSSWCSLPKRERLSRRRKRCAPEGMRRRGRRNGRERGARGRAERGYRACCHTKDGCGGVAESPALPGTDARLSRTGCRPAEGACTEPCVPSAAVRRRI